MMILGKMKAVVKQIDDPKKMRRIKVVIPSIDPEELSSWAYPCDSIKRDWLPQTGDIVWVEYEGFDTAGDLLWTGLAVAKDDVDEDFRAIYEDSEFEGKRHLFRKHRDYIGNSITWSPDGFLIKDLAGQTILVYAKSNEEKIELKTKDGISLLLSNKLNENAVYIQMISGAYIKLDDQPNTEKIEIFSKSGNRLLLNDQLNQEKIELQDKYANTFISDKDGSRIIDRQNNRITLKNTGILLEDMNGNKIEMKAGMIDINGTALTVLQ